MISYIYRDVREIEKGIVAHGCNCLGVAGAGIALTIRTKWPKAFQAYKSACDSTNKDPEFASLLGRVIFVVVGEDLLVANCLTQVKCGRNGKYAEPVAIKSCLSEVCRMARAKDLEVYMPKIGCGLGGLDWDSEVRPVIEEVAAKYSDVFINVIDTKGNKKPQREKNNEYEK